MDQQAQEVVVRHPAAGWFILANVFVGVIYDIWLKCYFGDRSTLSFFLLQYSMESIQVPFIAGLLCGHIFCDAKVLMTFIFGAMVGYYFLAQ